MELKNVKIELREGTNKKGNKYAMLLLVTEDEALNKELKPIWINSELVLRSLKENENN